MTRGVLPLAAIIGAVLLVPSADAKFDLAITLEPTRPTARSAARVVLRTDIDLPKAHGIRLVAVGPWRKNLGQSVLEIQLAWTAVRTLTGHVRFPYPGRWHLHVPPSGASGAGADRWVRVRLR
jgi:hypothetical protein